MSVKEDLEIIKTVKEQRRNNQELYEWQSKAIDYFFENGNNALYEVTTGAGKTKCTIEILKRVLEQDPNVKVLIVVPKNVILETGWYKELYREGINLKHIGVFYGAIKEMAQITLTNMQNLNKIFLDDIDFLILDECHNYMVPSVQPFIEEEFKYKLGLSATIERSDGKHWGLMKVFDYNVFKYTPRQALDDGVLNPFKFCNVSVEMDDRSFDEYNVLTQEINQLLLAGGGYGKIMRGSSKLKLKMLSKMNARKQLVNNYVRKFDVVRSIVRKHCDEKIIIFNQFNDQTNKLYWHLLELGVKAKVYHSDLSKEVRDQILTDYKMNKFSVLLTTKALDEGYDLPSISCGVIMAGDNSSRQIVQRLGRVLRRKDRDSSLYQIYCMGTIEEEQADNRNTVFKELCLKYGKCDYRNNDLEVVIPDL